MARDICDILGFERASDALRGLDNDEKLIRKSCVSGQTRDVNVINESGSYSLELRSRKPEAKALKKWVTFEVLPAIRKKGGYLSPVVDFTNPKTIQRILV